MGGKFDTMLFGLVGHSSRDTLVVRDHIQSRDMLARLDKEHPPSPVVPEHDGKATVAAYSVVHGRDGAPDR